MSSNKHLGKGLYLGQVVRFTKVLVRTVGENDTVSWTEKDVEQCEGVVVGLRTLQSGKIVLSFDDFGGSYPEWRGVPDVPCVLVATNIYRNFIRVPYQHVMDVIEDEKEQWIKEILGYIEEAVPDHVDVVRYDPSPNYLKSFDLSEATSDGGSSD